ncbi:hypothetical protein EMIT0P44_30185 [Pseudomonas sp. IT-P44]
MSTSDPGTSLGTSIRRPGPSHREQHGHTRKENPKNGWRADPVVHRVVDRWRTGRGSGFCRTNPQPGHR